MMRTRDLPQVRDAQGFIALSKGQKTEFFRQKLDWEARGILAEAVMRTMSGREEHGGGLSYDGKKLVAIPLKNYYKENIDLAIEGMETLARDVRRRGAGVFGSDYFFHNFQKMNAAAYGLKLVFGSFSRLNDTAAAQFPPSGTINIQWLVGHIGSVSENNIRTYLAAMRRLGKEYGYDPVPVDETGVAELASLLQTEPSLIVKGGWEPVAEKMRGFLMDFHTHPAADGFNSEDLRVVSTNRRMGIIAAPSRDMRRIDIHLAEPSAQDSASDLGVVFAYPSGIDIVKKAKMALLRVKTMFGFPD